MKNPTRLIWLVLLFAGLAIRCGLPFFLDQNPAKGDGGIYVQHTENLKYHGIYSSQQAEFPQPTYDHMPGMPFYLYVIFKVVDRESPWAILPNLLLGWGILVLLGSLLKKLEVREAVRLIALGVYALFPILDYYALQFYPEVPAAFLTVLGFLCLFQLMKSGKWQWALWSGVVFTLAVFFRPELILNFAVAGGALLLGKLPWQKVLLYGGLMAVILIGLLTPWTIRNYRVSGEVVFLARNHAPGTAEERAEEERGCAKGLYLWLNTWHTTERHVKIAAWDFMNADLEALPASAFSNPEEKEQVQGLQNAPAYTCGLDQQLETLAYTRIEAAPLKFGLWLPLQRCFHLLFRVERFDSSSGGFFLWLGYALLCNLIVGLGLLGAILIRKRPQLLWLMVAAITMRLIWFAWFYHVEYRYMLIYFPLFFILAAYFSHTFILQISTRKNRTHDH